ncbi:MULTISPECIES: flagellar biosynthetic protein FliQ [Lacrimispora]|uniref:Flagellar biosynthetic protein FliQ n=2 Tax=Lacrimispora TaxID=2719231 RepID=A0A2S6HMJ0_9FIRM|nr:MULTISPECIES: flagellar biosynthetic protein FliQ [Clostridia]MBE5976628.1 flagellar biosynthetic protein FliQ [Paenibacillaceae bacterium]MBE5982595.1 flagellar biosynthetic protein FliQ [Paenibacillaceae bacterium]MBE5988547.1 flagellar biosynthetic protein FliQ [Paenibacillaceae bacterium]NNJ31166.1 flagellar biosynthetic protein FliQ [Lacrimispora defluvii]PPK78707.1 flagellar biosynthetic protein FliQ [Hungatella xylanolytica]
MTDVAISSLMYEMFGAAVKLAGPVLVVSMIIGILISILQAATQIHEQTITFVPKLLVVGLILLMMGSNMMKTLSDFTIHVFNTMLG